MGKKKGKKGKKDETPAEEVSEYDGMDREMLGEVVPMLKQQLAKKTLDRNYVQLERDALQQFYDISRGEVRDVQSRVAARDRDMELLEENHRVELRVYLQKVRHLEYEHRHALRSVGEDTQHHDAAEREHHEARTHTLKRAKNDIRKDLGEREISNAEEVTILREQHAKNLKRLRLEFEEEVHDLGLKCQKRLSALDVDLRMRRKVHIHEIEERKNLHINDLIRNHDKAFGQMKQYYNTITSDNLKLITSLKTEVRDMRANASQNKITTKDVSAENAKLREPLTVAVAEVAELRARLRGRTSDQLSLRNSRNRLKLLEGRLQALDLSHASLKTEAQATLLQRDALKATFAQTVASDQQRANVDNVLLEQKVQTMRQAVDNAAAQTAQIVQAAGLDAEELGRAHALLENDLARRNESLRDAKYEKVRSQKAYNDALRTYSQKLVDLGIPSPEIDAMGFTLLPSYASSGPAGLVVQ